MSKVLKQRGGQFITTKEHRRFVEFANTVRKYRYIGLCYGRAGVGKTLSAKRYSNWQTSEPLLQHWGARNPSDKKVYSLLSKSRTLFFTPSISGSLTEIQREFKWLVSRINICIESHINTRPYYDDKIKLGFIELIIIDESERLKHAALEHLRDIFDRNEIGMIFIGMPGIEKRLSRFPQFYSRIGFVHQYHQLKADEIAFILQRHLRKFNLEIDLDNFNDNQSITSIARITNGNFRLLHRLLIQIERIMHINEVNTISEEVIDTAKDALVIGIN